METVLTIAGFDPSSGAGVTADLMVFAAHGLFGTSCITSLTVQSTLGVASSNAISANILRDTLACLQADLPPAGIKIGMLATAENVRAVADYLETIKSPIPIVLDPVLRSTSGRELLDPQGLIALRERLLPLVDWITPNLAELALLSGEPVQTLNQIPKACHILQQRNSLGILATGGHLDPPDDFLITAAGRELWLPGIRVETRSTHGTGCALSSAFLANLVSGATPEASARQAKSYVTQALTSAEPRGSGHGPMNHLWPLRPSTPV